MKKFEYKVVHDSEVILKNLGSQGWELCTIDKDNYYYFKREIL